MRLVHLTDLHVQTTPGLGDLLGKRLIGTANLFLLGRRSKFSAEVQRAAVHAALAQAPDALVVTGDLTAQGLPAEFAAAKVLLDPLLAAVPTAVIPGNHDIYVREASPGAAMLQVFGPWMGGGMPYLRDLGGLNVLAIETCRPHPLSAGHVAPSQLRDATRLLAEAGDPPFILLIHYPLRGRSGAPYGPWTRNLANAAELEAWLRETGGVRAILHGHEHHGFQTTVETRDGSTAVYDPGASGYSRLPDLDRTAHFNCYEIEDHRVVAIERYSWDGAAFVPEAGGAYQSGR
jgi:3',5'-cyclic AMP phosphodiesterase CpdA